MRVVLQRVTSAEVAWSAGGRRERRAIGPGLAILVGVGPEDGEPDAERLAQKVANLRIFADAEGKSNRSLLETAGAALAVSQFTLYADFCRGRRPSFIGAGDPARGEMLYRAFCGALERAGIPVQTGAFGAHMTVSLSNDGPMTLALSTDDWPTRV